MLTKIEDLILKALEPELPVDNSMPIIIIDDLFMDGSGSMRGVSAMLEAKIARDFILSHSLHDLRDIGRGIAINGIAAHDFSTAQISDSIEKSMPEQILKLESLALPFTPPMTRRERRAAERKNKKQC